MKAEKLKTAKTIKEGNCPLTDGEKVDYQKNIKAIKTPRLRKQEQVIMTGKRLKKVTVVNSRRPEEQGEPTMMVGDNPVQGGAQSFLNLECKKCILDSQSGSYLLQSPVCSACHTIRTEGQVEDTILAMDPVEQKELADPILSDVEVLSLGFSISAPPKATGGLTSKLVQTHGDTAWIKQLNTSLRWVVPAEMMIKHPVKLTLRSLFVVFIAVKKFLL